jgi:hypothetical protein
MDESLRPYFQRFEQWGLLRSLTYLVLAALAAHAVYFAIRQYLDYRVRTCEHDTLHLLMLYRQIARLELVMVASRLQNSRKNGHWELIGSNSFGNQILMGVSSHFCVLWQKTIHTIWARSICWSVHELSII